MCRVKKGAQLTSDSDLQNLVTATILRSTEPYSVESLTIKIQLDCEGSPLQITPKKISELVNDTSTTFLRYEFLDCFERKYYPRRSFSY